MIGELCSNKTGKRWRDWCLNPGEGASDIRSELDRALPEIRKSDKVVSAASESLSTGVFDLAGLLPVQAAPKRSVRTIGDKSYRAPTLESAQQNLLQQLLPGVRDTGAMVSKVEKLLRKTMMPRLLKLGEQTLSELGRSIENDEQPAGLTLNKCKSSLNVSTKMMSWASVLIQNDGIAPDVAFRIVRGALAFNLF